MKRILLVDDEPVILKLAATRLRSHGYEVLTATSGPECLELLNQTTPDVILLDVMMADMDGYETLKKIRERKDARPVPVIMFSARAMEVEKNTAIKQGAVDYVVKPFKAEELFAAVERALSGAG